MSIAFDALLLRDWAAHLLFTNHRLAPPAVSDEAWRFFLMMECCTLPLQKLQGQNAVVGEIATLESARVASARRHVAALVKIAEQENLRVVLLKGAVAVMAGVSMYLEDVDVLCSHEDANVLAAHFEGSWQADTYSTQPARGDIRIEIHRCKSDRSNLLDSAVRAVHAPGLWQLSAREYLWNVLHHSVSHHPDRVARLRDLLIVKHALASCNAQDFAHVAQRCDQSPARTSLLAILQFARYHDFRSLASVERFVRTRYFMLARFRGLGRSLSGQTILTYAAWLTASPRMPSIRAMFTPPDWPSRFRALALLATRAPHLDRAIRLATRPFILAAAGALVISAVAEDRLRFAARGPAALAIAATLPQP